MPSLNPASAKAFSNPLASASKSGKETVWVTPILGMIFLDAFSWAKERTGETMSRRIDRERSLLVILNQVLNLVQDLTISGSGSMISGSPNLFLRDAELNST